MPYKPGQSGNPAGRKPGSTSYKHMIQEAFLDIMNTKVKNGKTMSTYYDVFLQKLMKDALSNSDYRARQFMAERLLEPGVLDSIDEYINKGKKMDEDFLRYRVHLLAHDIQQEYILSKDKRIFQMAGRRAGKTDGHILKCLDSMQCRAGSKTLYIARTVGVGMDQMFNQMISYCEKLGIDVLKDNRSEGYIQIENGSEFYIKGNASTASRENMRGGHYDIIIIDEAQSQDSLSYLIQDICEPMLLDTGGTLVLSGTGPRIGGSFWEEMYTNLDKYPGKRMNWNLSQNPFINNYEKVLDEVKKEKGLTNESPLFQREYLGRICYDTDAMVYRLGDNNFYTDTQLQAWINSQPRGDLHFTGGLDYGFRDSDGFVIILYSTSSPERWIVFEHKGNRTGVTELADKIKEGIKYTTTSSLFTSIPDKHFYIYSDSGGAGKKISFELNQQFGLSCLDAYKANKDMAIELLQEETRKGIFKVKKDSIFADEALKTIWGRNDKDELTREIDDGAFHPDLLDAVLYSMRYIWQNYTKPQ